MSKYKIIEFNDRDVFYSKVIESIKNIDKKFSNDAKNNSTIIVIYKDKDKKDKIYINNDKIDETLVKNIICSSLFSHIKNKQMKYQVVKRDEVVDWMTGEKYKFKEDDDKSLVYFVINLDKIFTLKKKLPENIREEIINILNLFESEDVELDKINYSDANSSSKLLKDYKKIRFGEDVYKKPEKVSSKKKQSSTKFTKEQLDVIYEDISNSDRSHQVISVESLI